MLVYTTKAGQVRYVKKIEATKTHKRRGIGRPEQDSTRSGNSDLSTNLGGYCRAR